MSLWIKMKRIGLLVAGFFLSASPPLCMEEYIYKSMDCILGVKFIPLTGSNNENPKIGELQDAAVSWKDKVIPLSAITACDPTIKQESISPVSSSNNIQKFSNDNKGVRAHFVGDAYGWCIVYY
jgi:hypothetical protein